MGVQSNLSSRLWQGIFQTQPILRVHKIWKIFSNLSEKTGPIFTEISGMVLSFKPPVNLLKREEICKNLFESLLMVQISPFINHPTVCINLRQNCDHYLRIIGDLNKL